jgi:molecular chaperone HtpG
VASGEKDKYATFWKEFGSVVKEGVGEDFANKEKIAGLLRFASTHTDTADETVSFADYVARMKEGQDKIYYVTAESFNAARNSPHLEVFRSKGIEVLLLADRVDEWVVSHVTEFDGKPLVSIARGGLDLGGLEDATEKEKIEADATELKEFLDKVKKTLGERVKDVRVTRRLNESPACLVADEHDVSANLARMLKAAGQRRRRRSPSSKSMRSTRSSRASRTRCGTSTIGRTCCSTRRCWPKVASSTIRRRSSSASTN